MSLQVVNKIKYNCYQSCGTEMLDCPVYFSSVTQSDIGFHVLVIKSNCVLPQ